ncbi:glycoside hydrolase, partial [Metschnikowia bicuspidata]
TDLILPPVAIAWSPHRKDHSLKSQDQVIKDIVFINKQRILRIRIHGTEGLLVPILFNTCKKLRIRIDQGFEISLGGVNDVDEQLTRVIGWAKDYGWDIFSSFTVGYEPISKGYRDALQLISKITEVKARLAEAGYEGPITTLESADTFINNPELCQLSEIDFIGIKVHPYFSQNPPKEAGQFILAEKKRVERICNKPVKIVETGYPTAGKRNGQNIPSKRNQLIALNSIWQATKGDVTYMSLYDELWKRQGPKQIERHFGIFKPTY